jgi:hypothetical protein
LKLPAESTKPKETHPVPTSERGGAPPGPAGTP